MTENEFEVIYKEYYPKTYNWSMKRFKGNKFYAEEIGSYVFMKLWENQPVFENKNHCSAWIWRTLKNKYIDIYRTNIYHAHYSLNEEHDIMLDYSTEMVLLKNFRAEEIVNVSKQLTSKYRSVFDLLFLKELTPAEICEELNLSNQTIRNELWAIRKKFRKAITY